MTSFVILSIWWRLWRSHTSAAASSVGCPLARRARVTTLVRCMLCSSSSILHSYLLLHIVLIDECHPSSCRCLRNTLTYFKHALTVAFNILKIDQYVANISTRVQGLAFPFKVVIYLTVNRDAKSVAYLLLGGEKNKPHKDDVYRSTTAVLDYMHFFDENTTVNGVLLICDYGHWTMKVEAYLPMQERRYMSQTWQVRTNILFLQRVSNLA